MAISSSDANNLRIEEDDLLAVTEDIISIIENEDEWNKTDASFVKQQLRKFPYTVRRFLSQLKGE